MLQHQQNDLNDSNNKRELKPTKKHAHEMHKEKRNRYL